MAKYWDTRELSRLDSSCTACLHYGRKADRGPWWHLLGRSGRAVRVDNETIMRTGERNIIDSTRENRRQEEFNNRVAQVKRPGDRRSVEWLCRRGGRRLGVCWRAGAGVGAVVEAAIGERAAQPFVEEENEPGNPGLRRGRL
jgi:hypothetical protein